jgi:hypothetical protein
MKASFESHLGMIHEGEVTATREAGRACEGLAGLVWGALAYESILLPYVRIENDEGLEIEVYPERVKYEK